MNTYKITFNLLTAVSFIDLPTFDGILSYAFAREVKKDTIFEQKLNYLEEELIDFSKMPLCKHKNGYFLASTMRFDNANEIIEDTQRWRKRFDCKHDYLADFGKNKRKIDITRGEFKSYDTPFGTKLIDNCYFIFQSDNVNFVEYLLKTWVHFLGKKRSQGCGAIKDFTIEKTTFDFNTIFRPIPIKLYENFNPQTEYNIKYCAYQPPYWLPQNFEKCLIP